MSFKTNKSLGFCIAFRQVTAVILLSISPFHALAKNCIDLFKDDIELLLPPTPAKVQPLFESQPSYRLLHQRAYRLGLEMRLAPEQARILEKLIKLQHDQLVSEWILVASNNVHAIKNLKNIELADDIAAYLKTDVESIVGIFSDVNISPTQEEIQLVKSRILRAIESEKMVATFFSLDSSSPGTLSPHLFFFFTQQQLALLNVNEAFNPKQQTGLRYRLLQGNSEFLRNEVKAEFSNLRVILKSLENRNAFPETVAVAYKIAFIWERLNWITSTGLKSQPNGPADILASDRLLVRLVKMINTTPSTIRALDAHLNTLIKNLFPAFWYSSRVEFSREKIDPEKIKEFHLESQELAKKLLELLEQ